MNGKAKFQVVAVAVLVAVAAFVTASCTTNQQTTAYNAAGATDAAVRTAMIGWGAYVSVAHPGTNTELTVRNAFLAYRNSELAVIDATEAVSTNPQATNLLNAAVIAERAAQADLLNIIKAYTNSPGH